MNQLVQILLVEDTPSDVRLTQEALKRSNINCNLSVANDGIEAMEYLMARKSEPDKMPHIILLDLNMPRKNGHEVLAEIESDVELKKIPVILLTVSERDEDVLEALRLKMNYYVAKPVTSEKISVLIRSIYELHADEHSAESAGNEEIHVKFVLAGNPHTSAIALARLADDASARVRRRVAENPNVPETVLAKLALDQETDVRLSITENPNTPDNILESLASDASDDVRMGMASNRRTPVSLLQRLANDENVYVSTNAKKSLTAKTLE